jgi:hypothetical protein
MLPADHGGFEAGPALGRRSGPADRGRAVVDRDGAGDQSGSQESEELAR